MSSDRQVWISQRGEEEMTTHTRLTVVLLSLAALTLALTACGGAAFGATGGSGGAEEGGPAIQLAPRAGGDSVEAEATEAPMGEAADGFAAVEEAEEPAFAGAPPAAGNDQPPPDAMFFEDYGDNPFVTSASDNLSTFAVDVDTGSYTVARNYLNSGNLPPAEAIRLEEFVNYFDYDYPYSEQWAFSIHLQAAPTPFSQPGNVVLRVGLQGYDVPADLRPDAVLIFVIDVSGSMEGPERLGAVKEALYALVGSLRPTDQVGIVVYGSQGRVVLEPAEVGQGDTIKQAIASLQSEGSTNAEEGLRLAYSMATAYYDPNKINRLILCSDGVANVGVTGPDAILETVRQQAREGITLTTVGFGMGNYNDVLMEQLADDGDGQYFYVDTQDEARRVFVENLTGTLLTIARNAKVQVEFNGEVVSHYRLMGYENRDVADQDFRNDDVDAGEIGAGHSVTALYELVLNEQAQGQVAIIRLRWEDPESGEVTEIEQALAMSDIRASFDDASPSFRLAVVVAALADALGNGAWAQTAPLDVLLKYAETLAAEMGNNADVQELPALIREVMRLKAQKVLLKPSPPTPSPRPGRACASGPGRGELSKRGKRA